MSGPGKILLGLMSEHDNRVHASGHGGQADPVLRQDFSLGVVPEVEVGGRGGWEGGGGGAAAWGGADAGDSEGRGGLGLGH